MSGMSRRQVAARLGVSISTVRRMEHDRLHPAVDAAGRHTFDPSEVEAVAGTISTSTDPAPSPTHTAALRPQQQHPNPTSGEVAAIAFADFNAGKPPAEVVVARALPPDLVRRLHADWLDLATLAVNAPDGSKRLSTLEKRLTDLHAYAVSAVAALNALHARVFALPVPAPGDFNCADCGTSGCVTVPATCSACGARTDWGTRPS